MYISTNYLLPSVSTRASQRTAPKTSNIHVPHNRVLVVSYEPTVTANPLVLSQSTSGLVLADSFDRSDSDTPGNNWLEEQRDWDIVSNQLACTNAQCCATGQGFAVNDIATSGEMFLQMTAVIDKPGSPNNEQMLVLGNWSGHRSDASWEGYAFGLDRQTDTILLYKVVSDTVTHIGPSPVARTGGGATTSSCQLFVADGLQEAYIEDSGGGNSQTISATDTSHDAASRNAGVLAGTAGITNRQVECDDFLWCSTRDVVVSSVPSGHKAKIRNSGMSVVAEATESGGTATIDASSFGGATEIVPLIGWADIVVTNASDVVVATYDSTGVYPGDTYTVE